MSRTIPAVVLSVIFATTVFASSRVRLDEGARARQTRLASSRLHTCAVLDDGTVSCWGNNSHGELGDGTTTTQKVPVPVSNLTNVVSVTAGVSHSCAVRADGSAWCWGDNLSGELGDGTTTSSAVPVLAKVSHVVAVSAGGKFTCALKADGKTWCWGSNTVGQLGMTPGGISTVPVLVGTLAAGLTVSAGENYACALIVGGTVQCWGSNTIGQLGNGTTSASSPVGSVLTSTNKLNGVVDVSTGRFHSCALIADGSVRCWGNNDSGQLGDNSTASLSNVAVTVITDPNTSAPLNNAVAVSAGGGHSCALLGDGDARCWGDDSNGQLGDGIPSTTPRSVANVSVKSLGNAFELVTGDSHTCAIEADSWILKCWGLNASGQLGNGSINSTATPIDVKNVAGSIGGRSLHALDDGNCARRGNDTMACWGDGNSGQLGYGQFVDSASAVSVTSITDAISFSGKNDHTCAVRSSGTVSCWGENGDGQLGDGHTFDQALPVTVAGLSNVIQVAAGFSHTCALLTNGKVRCWGSNSKGELGDGTFTPSLTPVTVSNLSGVVMISAGDTTTCAVTVNGSARCWGDNQYGELGDGQLEIRSSVPVAVSGLNITTAITAAYKYSCALSANGTASCWGDNDSGELGNNSTLPTSVPDDVTKLSNAIALSAGAGLHTCAVIADGSASCWGNNSFDQLSAENNRLTSYLSPTAVIKPFLSGSTPVKLADVIAISTGSKHTCSLHGSGGLRCWGNNTFGQLGNGTTSPSKMSAVNSFTANVKPDVLVRSRGRIAEVTALMNCSEGSEAHIYLTLQQGQTTGSGQGNTKCTGGQVEVPLTVPAQGPSGFQSGPATANVEAVVREKGTITEDQHWTRAVTISIQP